MVAETIGAGVACRQLPAQNRGPINRQHSACKRWPAYRRQNQPAVKAGSKDAQNQRSPVCYAIDVNMVWIVYRRCVVPVSLKLYYRSGFVRDTDQSVSLTQVRRLHAFVFVLSVRHKFPRKLREINERGKGRKNSR